MSKDTWNQINRRLEKIQKDLEAKQSSAKSNKEAAVALCHFLNDTINGIKPGEIKAEWYGSYHNAGVADYPNVTIKAYHVSTHITLASWRINTGGHRAAPNITQDDILGAVLEGLEKIQVNLMW